MSELKFKEDDILDVFFVCGDKGVVDLCDKQIVINVDCKSDYRIIVKRIDGYLEK